MEPRNKYQRLMDILFMDVRDLWHIYIKPLFIH